jgi:hypothetical protein
MGTPFRLTAQRQLYGNARPPSGRCVNAELTAQDVRPLMHPHQAARIASELEGWSIKTGTVIFDLHTKRITLSPHAYGGPAYPSVPSDIGQRFLHNAVGRDFNLGTKALPFQPKLCEVYLYTGLPRITLKQPQECWQ